MARPAVIVCMQGDRVSGVVRILQQAGLPVRSVPTICDAVRLLVSGERIGAVLTSVALSDGNWRDLVDQVTHHNPAVVIALCAESVTPELWWDALDWGVSDIVSPPHHAADFDGLLQALDQRANGN